MFVCSSWFLANASVWNTIAAATDYAGNFRFGAILGIAKTRMGTNSMDGGLRGPFFAHSRPFPAVLVGGLIVGALDLAYAIVVYSPKTTDPHSANYRQRHPRREFV